jgi:acyl dehydratase
MAKTTIDGIAGLKALIGQELGTTEWKPLTFENIVAFADATGDHQWIHVDKERIAREIPFKKPVAHGYFSLSVIGGLFFELVRVTGMKLVINYGLNKVRFPAPLLEGQRYRLNCKLVDVKDIGNSTFESTMAAAVEIEGSPKPACAAELVFRFIAA